MRQLSRITLIAASLISAILLVGSPADTAQPTEPVSPHAPSWIQAPPGARLSTTATQGADTPVIQTVPGEVGTMVVYNEWVGGVNQRDPYYTVVQEDGSWSLPQAIHSSETRDSGQITLAFDDSRYGHALWAEGDAGIYYSRFDSLSLSWSTPLTMSVPGGFPLFDPTVVTSGEGTVDIFWGQNNPPDFYAPSIYHRRSGDDGQTWSAAQPIAVTQPSSRNPRAAVDANGRLHVLWHERTAEGGFNLLYSQGLPWSTPITIPTGVERAKQPSVVVRGNRLHVSFTVSVPVDALNINQWVYYTTCGGDCGDPNSWSTPVNISGQAVQVNPNSPFDLVSETMLYGHCVYVFFHGLVEAVSTQEVVWDVNSCDNWSGGGRDKVTDYDMRGIYPRAVVEGDQLFLVYEHVEDDNHQIYLMEAVMPEDMGEPVIFVPLVYKK